MITRCMIDGTNLIRSNPSLEKLEREKGSRASREKLIEMVVKLARREAETIWLLVFDGPGDVDAEKRGAIDVRYSGAQTADSLILQAAEDALAMDDHVRIVSSDNEVSIPGAEVVKSQDFYDELTAHAPTPAPEKADPKQKALKILEFLAKEGIISVKSVYDPVLRDSLRGYLDYYAQGDLPPQKLAKKIETFFRDAVKLNPDPDPQKVVYRKLKKYFETN